MLLLTWPLALWLCTCLHGVASEDIKSPELITGTFPFADIDIFYQMYDSGNDEHPVVLFLHGKAFTSDVWIKQGSLEAAHKQKFKAIAIDLPGYGRTKHLPYVDNNMRSEVVKATLEFAVQQRNLTSVMVTPSMSGRWVIPFLDRYGQMLGGWLAVAPVGVKSWGGPWEFTHKQVRLLAMYGDRDPMKEQADYLTKLFLHSTMELVPDAGHACYVDNRDVFNARLSEFLRVVDPKKRVNDVYAHRDL